MSLPNHKHHHPCAPGTALVQLMPQQMPLVRNSLYEQLQRQAQGFRCIYMPNAHLNRSWVLKNSLRIRSYLERRVDVQPRLTEKVPIKRVYTRLRANYRMLEKCSTYQ